jgi:hypothetical protein
LREAAVAAWCWNALMRRSRRARRGAPAAEDYTANQPPDVLDRDA